MNLKFIAVSILYRYTIHVLHPSHDFDRGWVQRDMLAVPALRPLTQYTLDPGHPIKGCVACGGYETDSNNIKIQLRECCTFCCVQNKTKRNIILIEYCSCCVVLNLITPVSTTSPDFYNIVQVPLPVNDLCIQAKPLFYQKIVFIRGILQFRRVLISLSA